MRLTELTSVAKAIVITTPILGFIGCLQPDSANPSSSQKSAPDISPELTTWISDYIHGPQSFEERQLLAFRVSRFNNNWDFELAALAGRTDISDRELEAIGHFTSARYTRYGAVEVGYCLRSEDSNVVRGQLRIIRVARTLRHDESDAVWPVDRLLDPERIPRAVGAVVKRHPKLAGEVASTLELYGSDAREDAHVLVPFLLSKDQETVDAVHSSIFAIDPEGLSQALQLGTLPLSVSQQNQVADYMSSPLPSWGETIFSQSNEPVRRQQMEIARLLRLCKHGESSPVASDRNLIVAKMFSNVAKEGGWWRAIVLFCSTPEYDYAPELITLFASMLYSQADSWDEVRRLLSDENPAIVELTIQLIESLYEIKSGVPIDVQKGLCIPAMTEQLVECLDRHPSLRLQIGCSFRQRGPLAKPYASRLVPSLLSRDPYTVEMMSWCITGIDSDLAERLSVTKREFVPLNEHLRTMHVLRPEQRVQVEKFLAELTPADVP